MKKRMLKVGGFLGVAAVAGYKAYEIMRKRSQSKKEEEIIDITPETNEAMDERQ